MTVTNVTAPHPVGVEGRPSPAGKGDQLDARTPKRTRSARELTPFVFLAMILIPSMVVLCLAIADPGAKSAGPTATPAVSVVPGP